MKRILISILVAAVTVAGCVRNEEVAPKPVEHGEYATVLNGHVPENGLLPYVSIKCHLRWRRIWKQPAIRRAM